MCKQALHAGAHLHFFSLSQFFPQSPYSVGAKNKLFLITLADSHLPPSCLLFLAQVNK